MLLKARGLVTCVKTRLNIASLSRRYEALPLYRNVCSRRLDSIMTNESKILVESARRPEAWMFTVYLSIISASVSCFAVSTGNAQSAETQAHETPTTDQVSRHLVLGGNGFMGSSLVTRLLSSGKHVTILNRGNWYFDSRSRVEPYVEHLLCDRSDIDACTGLINSTQYYEAVIDFTSYYGEDIKSILDVVRGRYERYIYISSDSVYEVCVENTHVGPNREEDAIRPSRPQERHTLNRKDWYGHRKLECEEILEMESEAHGMHYVILRLPDVIGPRDTTDRFWNYQIWLQSHHLERSLGPVHLNPQKNKLMSLVYSEDVSDVILKLLDAGLDVYNEAYNVAFESAITLEEFLETMAEFLGIKDVAFDRTENANVHWYPSVTRGPVDVTKISEKLSWKPSSFQEALRSSCRFYRDAMHVPKFRKRRDKIMKRYIFGGESWNRFLKEQGVSLGLHDEL